MAWGLVGVGCCILALIGALIEAIRNHSQLKTFDWWCRLSITCALLSFSVGIMWFLWQVAFNLQEVNIQLKFLETIILRGRNFA